VFDFKPKDSLLLFLKVLKIYLVAVKILNI